MIRQALATAALAAGLTASGLSADEGLTRQVLSFDDLEGWAGDDHGAALVAFQESCDLMDDPDWRAICALAQTQRPEQARAFFELLFRPVMVDAGTPGLFTGYFEPELNGSRTRSARFRYPLYRRPLEARSGQWKTRRDIMTSGVMEGRGLEIVWVDDPVEKFFLQIQGSGRVKLAEGGAIRVGYGGNNGHKYRSVGAELVRRGVYNRHQVSAAVIRNWVRRNPAAGQELLFHNPSYVFFREVNVVAEKGPLGAMVRSVTPMRSVAVDPAYVTLGAPVWVEKDGANPIRRLMVAQDTGSAIKGAQRADIFFGSGDEAGAAAGRLKDPGRMLVLMPIQRAYALETSGGDQAG